MEKILITKYGEAISFNEETNSITPSITNIDCNICRANKDGQVISKTEVIDVKEGEFILTATTWLDNKSTVKVVVISDPVAIHDLGEWYKQELEKSKQ